MQTSLFHVSLGGVSRHMCVQRWCFRIVGQVLTRIFGIGCFVSRVPPSPSWQGLNYEYYFGCTEQSALRPKP